MKTLVNKDNPQIRIIAPEIERRKAMFYQDEHYCLIIKGLPWLDADDWTLVEEEPKHTEVWVEGRTIFEQDAKKPEVDLEKEIREWYGLPDYIDIRTLFDTAKHFYELGLKARKEE